MTSDNAVRAITGLAPMRTDERAEASIASRAAAILAQEMQTLAAGTMLRLPDASSFGGVPVRGVSDQASTLIDAVSRALGQPPGKIAELIGQFLRMNPAGRSESSGTPQGVRRLRVAGTVRPGDRGQVNLRLANDDTEADECTLVFSDLIGASGCRIPAAHVRAVPQPARVPPGGSVVAAIEIRVPSGIAQGLYSGLLQTDDGESLQAILQVQVRS